MLSLRLTVAFVEQGHMATGEALRTPPRHEPLGLRLGLSELRQVLTATKWLALAVISKASALQRAGHVASVLTTAWYSRGRADLPKRTACTTEAYQAHPKMREGRFPPVQALAVGPGCPTVEVPAKTRFGSVGSSARQANAVST
jgi:hypothetical protein